MKHTIICLLLWVGVAYSLQAQDKIVLRNGRSIEVKVQRTHENRVEYTYPGETSVYERPKTAISYILYEDGRKEICDESLRESERSTTSRVSSQNRSSGTRTQATSKKQLSNDDEIFWQDVKTTFNDSDVSNMTRLRRISAVSNTSYKDAIQQLKKKAAALGGTTILIMDIPEGAEGDDIEVMGIAYRDEEMTYTPRSASERTTVPVESSSNVRRRRIAQQMESYNNESNLEFEDYAQKPQQTQKKQQVTSSRDDRSSTRETYNNEDSPDAIYLMSGRVIRGSIEEFEPDDFVSIRTPAGKIYEYSMDDVKRVSRGSTRTATKSKATQKASRNASKYDDDSRYDSRSSSKSSRDYDDYRVSGYKGIFEAGYTLSFGVAEKGRVEFSTTHGYQINQYLFIGAGVGLHLYSARDAEMKKNMGTDKYPHYADEKKNIEGDPNTFPSSYTHGMDSSFMMLPAFVEIRGYLPLNNSPITPFASIKGGYSFNLSDGFGPSGVFFSPSVGAKYNISPKIGLLLSVGYTFQGLGDPKTTLVTASDGTKTYTINKQYGFYYYDTDKALYKTTSAQGVHIKVGIEF